MNGTTVERPLRGLLPYMASRRLIFALVVLSGVLHYGTVVVVPALGAYVAGVLLTGGTVGSSTYGALVAAVLLAGATHWWQQSIGHDWAYRLLKELRLRIVAGIERAAPGRLLGRRTGELAEVAKNDVSATEMFFAHTAGDYVGAVVVSLGALVTVALISPPVAGVLAVMAALVAAVPAVLARRASAQGNAVRTAAGAVAAEATDVVQGLRELVLAGRGADYTNRIVARTEGLGRYRRGYARRAGLEQITAELLLGLGLIALAGTTGAQVSAGTLEPQWLPVVAILGSSAVAPIATVSATARTLGEVSAAAARVLAIIGYPSQVREPDRPAEPSTGIPVVEFDRVGFGYPGAGVDVLREVTLRIEAGETVALVGSSGAGKTTCANLLLRFWDVDRGVVRIGGTDVRKLATADLRRLVSTVPQDVYLFHGTISENVRLGRPDATDQEVDRVGRLTGLDPFVAALPGGYDTPVGERGAALSGGQRQRIAIARALLTDAPVLVLDEAVSSLDTDSEQALHEGLEATRGSRTMLVVAHRLSTIRRADRVVVLAGGQVVASGTHDELVERSAAYRRILADADSGPADPA